MPEQPFKQVRILALGDSYTIGQSVDFEDRWPIQLGRRLREEGIEADDPEIIARTGWTTRDLSLAIDRAAPVGPYELVTLMIGVNNHFQGWDIDEYRDGFRVLLRRAVALAGNDPTKVVVLSIPDWSVTPFAQARNQTRLSAELDLFSTVNKEEADEAGTRFIDVAPISREAAADLNLLANDGLHPSGRMYAAWIDRMLPEAVQHSHGVMMSVNRWGSLLQ